MDNGMQRVHTNRIVVYMYPGETRQLSVPEGAISRYARFYDYRTDGDISIGTCTTTGTQLYPNKGKYNENNAAAINYTAPATLPASGIVTELAYDLSYYSDMVKENNIVVIEPTLSTRIIFEIRPASEMQTKLDTCSNTDGAIIGKYLEHYHLLAPAGNVLTFGPAFP